MKDLIDRKWFAGSMLGFALTLHVAFAATTLYELIPIDAPAGPEPSTVTSMVQDDWGMVWLGTHDGLYRYDGVRFKVFGPRKGVAGGLSNGFIRGLARAGDGNLWLATADELTGFDPRSFTVLPTREPIAGPSEPGGLWVDADQVLWCGVGSHLQRFDPQSGEVTVFPLPPTETGLSVPGRIRIIIGTDQSLMLGTNLGLFHFSPRTRKMRAVPLLSAGRGSLDIRALALGKGRLLWVATDAGLQPVDLQSLEPIPAGQGLGYPAFSGDPISSLQRSGDGRLWIAAQSGLFAMDLASRRLFRFDDTRRSGFHLSAGRYSLPLNRVSPEQGPSPGIPRKVHRLLCDGNRQLWLTTSAGFFRLRTTASPWRRVDTADADHAAGSEPLSAPVVEADGRFWLATTSGLKRFDAKGIQQEDVPWARLGVTSTISSIKLLQGGDQGLWIGSDVALYHIDKQALRIDQTHRFDAVGNDNHRRELRQMVRDSAGRLWLATDHGVFSLDPQAGSTLKAVDPLGSTDGDPLWNNVFALQPSLVGEVWFGTAAGLVFWTPERQEFRRFQHRHDKQNGLSANQITAVLEDVRGGLWLGTAGGGLNHMPKPKEDHFVRYGAEEGLPALTITALVQDLRGGIWVGAGTGLFYLDPAQSRFVEVQTLKNWLGPHSGLSLSAKGRRLCLTHPGGLAFLEGKPPPPATAHHAMILSDVILQANFPQGRQAAEKPVSVLHQVLAGERLAEVGQFDRLSFEIGHSAYGEPLAGFEYQLQGYDVAWRQAEPGQTRLRYENLAPADYRLRLRRGPDANPTEVRSWPITIVGAASFDGLLMAGVGVIILLSALCAILAWKLFQRPVPPMLPAEEVSLGAFQKRVLANVSHELRTPLNGMIGLTQALLAGFPKPESRDGRQHLELIAASGRRLAGLLDDLLDFSDKNRGKEPLHLEPVPLKPLVDEVLALHRVGRQVESPALRNCVDAELPMVLADRHRLHQMIHNLVGNALKFTEEGEVSVSAQDKGAMIRITVADTGPGVPESMRELIFKPFRQGHGSTTRTHGGVGLGLAITRDLVERHGGTLRLGTEQAHGATFHLTLKSAGNDTTD